MHKLKRKGTGVMSAGIRAESYLTCCLVTGIAGFAAIGFAIPAIYYTIKTGSFSPLWVGTIVMTPISGIMGWYTCRY